MKKVLKIIVLAISFLLVSILVLLYFLFGDMCKNEVYKELFSPNKLMKVVIFQRDCGATTGFSTQVSILDNDEELENKSGNIFIIDGHPSKVAPEIYWKNNKIINIKYKLDGHEFKSEYQFGWFNKIDIIYE